MLLSEVTINDLKQYANVFHDEDDNLFTTILVAGKQFISTYTGLPLTSDDPTVSTCDNFEDLTICLMVLSNSMYDERAMIVDNTKVNFVVKQILDSHSINYL
jgi:hypothetical protein